MDLYFHNAQYFILFKGGDLNGFIDIKPFMNCQGGDQ